MTPCNHYNECGCELSACCLDCPLPVCKYELVQGVKTVRDTQRRLAILHLLDEGRSVDWIVQVLGISESAVYRAQRVKNTVTESLTDRARHAKLDVAAQ